MTTKKIQDIFQCIKPHWVGDGFRVFNYFPGGNDLGQKMSPFILLDYHAPYEYSPTDNLQRGVGPHPHRGFETVTLAFAGSIAHHDSAGNAGVINPGDAQWMTAASGVLHKEYHEKNFAHTGGLMHMVQLWVNLPKAHKMDTPRYQGLTADQMGKVELPDGAGIVRVIAGDYQGAKGPAKTFTPINMFDIYLNAQGVADFSFPATENTGVMVMQGDVAINGKNAKERDFVLFENHGETIRLQAKTKAHLLLLNGQPIDEPVVQYGPFVMNTHEEIEKAIFDFKSGQFGYLAD